ncbi:MAG: hypothetical protein K2F67_05375, partial [Eubacterium sp.]|nr:hypothetical protein [Eubacterium sp.]
VEVMKSNDLPEFYKDFGPDDAISKFTTHIGTCSYVVQLADNVRLLALNDDKNSDNHAGFTDAHFAWIEQQINKAYEDNCLIIGMEHHLLMPHISPLITGGGTCVANRRYVASRLADTGLRYMFVGHSHIQNTTDFTSEKGNTLTEVNVGSLVGYPAPIVHVTVHEDMTLSYEVEHLEEFMLDGKTVDAQKFLKNHALALIHRLLDSPNKQELADRLSALQMNGGKIVHYSALILPIFKFVKTARTIDLYKKLKYLGFAKMLDKSLFEKFKDKKVLDFVDEIMLSAFDGSITKYSRDDDYYILIMSVLSVLEKILNNNENIGKAVSAVDTILTGGKFDNQCAAI